jgi:hypothetical protein
MVSVEFHHIRASTETNVSKHARFRGGANMISIEIHVRAFTKTKVSKRVRFR